MATANKRRPHPVDVHVGQRIRHTRMLRGMSQTTLGEAIGVSYQQHQKYETGANRIGASRLYAIARVLDVPVSVFFEGTPEPEKAMDKELEELISCLSSRQVMDLNRNFMRIRDRTVRRRVIALINEIGDIDSRP